MQFGLQFAQDWSGAVSATGSAKDLSSGLAGEDSENALASDIWQLLSGLSVPVIVHDVDAGERIRFANAAFTQVFGYSVADVPTVSAWAERACPDAECRRQALARWWSEIELRRNSGTISSPGEYRLVDKTGRVRDVIVGFALHAQLVVVTMQDVTDVRAAETALAAERQKSGATAHALTENMPAGAYTMVLAPGESVAQFAFVSRQLLDMLELTREELLGDPATGFSRVHPDDRPRWLEKNIDAFSRKAPFSGEARIIAHGETRWIRAESVPRDVEDGSTIWEGVVVDITRLKETERRLQAVIDAAHAYTWTFDLKNRRLEFDADRGMPAGLPAEVQRVREADWMPMLHPDDVDKVTEAIASLGSGAVDKQIITYRRKLEDGGWVWLQVHAGVSARDANGMPTVLSGVSFDITAEVAERVRAQERQAELRENLQRAQQRDTVAQVAGGVAHDLSNLIAVVAGTTELLQRQGARYPGLLDGLSRIRRSVDMARDLIAGLGELGRPEQPRAVHDLNKLLSDAVELLGSRRIARHSVRVDREAEPLTIWANPTEVAQVVVNLALNACDSGAPDRIASVTLRALPANAPVPQCQPDVGDPLPADRKVALFTVSDTGGGISDTVRAQMFRPNYTTKGKSGTGLGLLIVSTIIQSNRAALWVDSTPGTGTTVTVAWPAVAASDPALQRSVPGSATTVPQEFGYGEQLNDVRALVVDDAEDVAEVLVGMLDEAGAIAFAEPDAQAVMRTLSEAPGVWSVLVTDLHMPDLDGLTLARFAGSLEPPIPVVLVTARPETLGDAPLSEFAAILPKPVSARRLVAAVRAAVDTRKPGDRAVSAS